MGAGDLPVGSDVFLNCFALADLLVRAAPAEKTGLFALVNNITEAVRALCWRPGEARPRAGLWYPAYWEDVEAVSYTHLDVYKRQVSAHERWNVSPICKSPVTG